jgi:hypothetical protein
VSVLGVPGCGCGSGLAGAAVGVLRAGLMVARVVGFVLGETVLWLEVSSGSEVEEFGDGV